MMDHLNMHLYRDGADMVIVIKNANTDIENTLTSLLTLMTNQSIATKEVPALKEPVTEEVKQPDIDVINEIFPDFLQDNVGDEVYEEKVEEKIEEPIPADNKPNERAPRVPKEFSYGEDEIAAMKIGQMEHYLFVMYEREQCKKIIEAKLKEKTYGDIFAFVRFEKEDTIRQLCIDCFKAV